MRRRETRPTRHRPWTRAAAWALALAAAVGPASPAAAQAAATAPAQAGDAPPRVLINGREVSGALVTPAGRIIVPMRPLFEAAGATLYWDPESRAVRAFYPGHSVTLQVGSRRAWKDSEEVVLDQEPVLVASRVFVPLRFAAEALAGSVAWDGEKREARVTLPLPADAMVSDLSPPPPPPVIPYTPEELELLARVINAEAFDEPYLGKVAVGAVVVNRVKARYSNGSTIRDVVMAPGQFAVVANGRIHSLPVLEDSWRAAREALSGRDPTGGALYFTNLRDPHDPTFWNSLTRTVDIGNHTFFKEPAAR